jgi:hypothetical protein
MGQPRIIRLETQSATQDVKDNIYEDIFMPFDGDGNYLNVDDLGDYEYIGFDGENHVYADGKGKRFFSKIGKGIGNAARGVGDAAKWVGGKIVDFVSKFGKAIRERQDKRLERKNKKLKDARWKARNKAQSEIEKKKLPPKEAQKLIEQAETQAVQKVEQENTEIEKKVTEAETQAYNETLAKTNDVEKAEKAANDAGLVVEGGYGIDTGVKVGFWSSMSTGAKVGLIGGGVLVTGLIIWGVVASKNNK